MEIHTHTGGLAATNCYLLIDETSGVAAMIDAPKDTTEPLLAICRERKLELKYLLLTHGHWDHTSDHGVVTRAFAGAKVMIHKLDEPKLEEPGSKLYPLPYTIPPRKADGYLEDGAEIWVGSIGLKVMHTPGHAIGHVCFYHDGGAGGKRVLFVGDLIMAGTVGRYDLPDSDLGQLLASVKRVIALPDDTHLLSGHGPRSTVGAERNGNRFMHERGVV